MGRKLFDEYLESGRKPTSRARRFVSGFGIATALFGCNALTQPYSLLNDGESGCYIPIGQDGANTRSGPVVTIRPDDNRIGSFEAGVDVAVSQVSDAGEFVHVKDRSGQAFFLHRSATDSNGEILCR